MNKNKLFIITLLFLFSILLISCEEEYVFDEKEYTSNNEVEGEELTSDEYQEILEKVYETTNALSKITITFSINDEDNTKGEMVFNKDSNLLLYSKVSSKSNTVESWVVDGTIYNFLTTPEGEEKSFTDYDLLKPESNLKDAMSILTVDILNLDLESELFERKIKDTNGNYVFEIHDKYDQRIVINDNKIAYCYIIEGDSKAEFSFKYEAREIIIPSFDRYVSSIALDFNDNYSIGNDITGKSYVAADITTLINNVNITLQDVEKVTIYYGVILQDGTYSYYGNYALQESAEEFQMSSRFTYGSNYYEEYVKEGKLYTSASDGNDINVKVYTQAPVAYQNLHNTIEFLNYNWLSLDKSKAVMVKDDSGYYVIDLSFNEDKVRVVIKDNNIMYVNCQFEDGITESYAYVYNIALVSFPSFDDYVER